MNIMQAMVLIIRERAKIFKTKVGSKKLKNSDNDFS